MTKAIKKKPSDKLEIVEDNIIIIRGKQVMIDSKYLILIYLNNFIERDYTLQSF